MLTLAILGFLAERPMHAYELKKHIAGLAGHVRTVSDGALYPAVSRLEGSGWLTRHEEPGQGVAPRQMITLTEAGRAELLRRLRRPSTQDITDRAKFVVVLSFLSQLPDPRERIAVLRRRWDFLAEPASFFYDGTRPLRADELSDPFRRGVLTVARATRNAEKAWLEETIRELEAGTAG
ncbi:PadR family transcriptional regulator [Streptomyces alanosinicus]|uniref:PadR family transcriptional regulator n=1 Tax=Streptomyces alanosinicus TaxID=68171 RepID=A0A918YMA9_9ACTN|nr:PadR family transcriptional regulator [Streptomyces alanosinicus]GHE08497.1 PadR family transcriptional regulator [Streptomyces alanosinicus]